MQSRFNRIMRLWVACVTAFVLVIVGLIALRAERVEAHVATTLIVTSTTDSGPGSLRSTIGLAQAGDTIQFNLAANSTIILTSGELTITVPITIDGSTATNLTLSGNHTNRIFAASVPLIVRSLTIVNGNSNAMGGGIDSTSTLTLSAVSFSGNVSDSSGGAVHALGAVSVSGGIFQNNHSTNGLGAASRR